VYLEMKNTDEKKPPVMCVKFIVLVQATNNLVIYTCSDSL